jgi:CubicO group peptidase (beta-lactamase class C family)
MLEQRFQATTRDFARVGQFILDGAFGDGGRSLSMPGSRRQRASKDTYLPGRGYGYEWWTRADDTFDPIGIHGEMIHVDPRCKLVVAINCVWPVASGKDPSAARVQLNDTMAAAVDDEASRQHVDVGRRYAPRCASRPRVAGHDDRPSESHGHH